MELTVYTFVMIIHLHTCTLWWGVLTALELRLIYVTGPAKIDQVGTHILTTFFTFVAS